MKATFTFPDNSTLTFGYPQSPRGLRIAGKRPISVEFSEERTVHDSPQDEERHRMWKIKCRLCCQQQEQHQGPLADQASAWRTIWQYCRPKINQLYSEQSGIESVLDYIKDLEADHVNWQETWNSFLLIVPPEDRQRFQNLTKPQAIIEYIKCLQKHVLTGNDQFHRLLATTTRAIAGLENKQKFIHKQQEDNKKLCNLLNEKEREIDRLKAQLESRNPLRFD